MLSRTDIVYDGRRNPVREVLSQAGTFYNVVDRSYDDNGRLLCEATRMNPATFLAVPGGCVPGTGGSFGPDRIARNFYDLAGQRLQRREGVGSAVEAAETTWAYNLNGQVTTVIDGNGNRAELRYDGHMRQDRWTFPSAARAAAYDDATQASAGERDDHCFIQDGEGLRIYSLSIPKVRPKKKLAPGTAFIYVSSRLDSTCCYSRGAAMKHGKKAALAAAALTVAAAALASETITYTYDARGRLVKVERGGTVNNGVKAEYKYDKGDNRTNVNVVSPN